MRYANRQKAGAAVAKAVAGFGEHDSVVLALPRGGVVVGAEVARALSLPLGVVLVRKIGHAVGAVVQPRDYSKCNF